MRIGSIFTLVGSGRGPQRPSHRALLTKAALAASLLLLGVDAHAEELRLSIDPSFSMYERATILQVVNEWESALQGARHVTLGEGDWKLRPSPASAITSASLCKGGTTNAFTREIILNMNCMPRGSMAPVLRHELGHMLGLPHIAHTLMDPTCCFDAQAIDPASAQMARAQANLKFVAVTR
jgi:hypothetical protein